MTVTRRVVLLHGFGADRLSFAFNQSAFEQHGTAHATDLPGHGRAASALSDSSVAGLSASVERLVDDTATGPVDIVGHSLGGCLAMIYAARRPEKVRSLFLIAPLGLGGGLDRSFFRGFPDLAEPGEARKLLSLLVARPGLVNDVMIARVLAQLDRPGARPALTALATTILDGQARFRAAAQSPALRAIPRTVIWGTEDRVNPPDPQAIERFGGTCVTVGNAGHMPHMERPTAVNRAIAAHFDAPGRSAQG